jgi:hypothetical protein
VWQWATHRRPHARRGWYNIAHSPFDTRKLNRSARTSPPRIVSYSSAVRASHRVSSQTPHSPLRRRRAQTRVGGWRMATLGGTGTVVRQLGTAPLGAAALRASPASTRPHKANESRRCVMVVSKDDRTLRQRALSRLQVTHPHRLPAASSYGPLAETLENRLLGGTPTRTEGGGADMHRTLVRHLRG